MRTLSETYLNLCAHTVSRSPHNGRYCVATKRVSNRLSQTEAARNWSSYTVLPLNGGAQLLCLAGLAGANQALWVKVLTFRTLET